ncbi:hypothetical protein ACVNS2_23940 [Paenibacillus caseinilyticus]|uniref:Calcium-binding protein n=1 Tax=Paenibacillus mucilaginosus K02 TaxID=997761 RepID=I0BMX6_9BACL|nr:hemolysin-type calcium-binding protein [Paenibacillus mucilaginosus]AFH63723.1 hypothetical protein B2K_24060 [Paenibacillus mucilaginosus K02]
MTIGQAPKLVFGTRGSDRIEASKEGRDRIFAIDGDDRIVVREGSGLTDLHGGLGNDKFEVAGDRTTAYGEGGDDLLSVSSAANRIYGNKGNDTLEVAGREKVKIL